MKSKENAGENELITNSISDSNRRIRLMEDRIDNLRSHLELLENNILEMNKSMSDELNNFNKTAHELRREVQGSIENVGKLAEKIDELASKDSVKVIEKYIDLLNPMMLVTRDELNEVIKDKLSKHKKK
jgi:predicted  nucleic acid-binding Zn-ribbon protein